MDLIRDVLDNQLVDQNQRRIGKVDGIVAALREGKPPILQYIETGWPTRVRRIHPGLARWMERWLPPAYRIPWTAIRDVGVDIEVAVEARQTPLLRVEDRLRRTLKKIPGA